MGLLGYYRQYEDLDQEEVNRGLRERRRGERARALEHVPELDLSSTEWPDFPNSEVVNASIAAARGRVNGYPDLAAAPLRSALAALHGVEAEQIAVGNGAAELMQTAAYLLLTPGDELVAPWPSYPLYPLMASRGGARPVPAELDRAGAVDPEAMLAAISERTRVMVVCNPNDPTGTYLDSDRLGALLARLPEHVHLLLDEAFVHFQDAEDVDAALRLTEAFPRLLVFRTFSKIYGLSGLRTGYAVGSKHAQPLIESLRPVLGVNALSQAAARQALKIGGPEVERRRAMVIEQRTRVLSALGDLGVEAPPSQANFVWLRADGLDGTELAARLGRSKVLVAAGHPLGDDLHVRAAIRGGAAADRLLTALERIR